MSSIACRASKGDRATDTPTGTATRFAAASLAVAAAAAFSTRCASHAASSCISEVVRMAATRAAAALRAASAAAAFSAAAFRAASAAASLSAASAATALSASDAAALFAPLFTASAEPCAARDHAGLPLGAVPRPSDENSACSLAILLGVCVLVSSAAPLSMDPASRVTAACDASPIALAAALWMAPRTKRATSAGTSACSAAMSIRLWQCCEFINFFLSCVAPIANFGAACDCADCAVASTCAASTLTG